MSDSKQKPQNYNSIFYKDREGRSNPPSPKTKQENSNPASYKTKKENSNPTPPKAKQVNYIHKKFDDERLDSYQWLNKKDSPEVLDYLEQENKYSEKILKPVAKIAEEIFQEIKNRIPQTDDSVPFVDGPYKYYYSWQEGKDYPIHKRIEVTTNKEEIILDENELAKKYKYCDISSLGISPNHQILAYALDSKGREYYDIYFKDLKTGKLLESSIEQVSASFVWANDNQHVFYIYQDRETLRCFQVYKLDILTGEKELVYEEKDERFSVILGKTLSEELIFIASVSSKTSEYWFIHANKPSQKLTLFTKRQDGHEYSVDYGDGIFYIMTNKDKAFNFKIMKVKKSDEKKNNSSSAGTEAYPLEDWEEMIPHRENILIEDYEVFKDYLGLETGQEANREIEIFNKSDKTSHTITFPEKIYSAELMDNCKYDTCTLRLAYDSFTQPPSVYDYDILNQNLELKKQKKILGGFQSKDYISKREFVKARDGEIVPISLIYKKDLQITQDTPLLLYGYGSYGISMNPGFNPAIFSLLNRGFVFVISHIRGGSEMGRLWYENGKFLKKKNSFYDFIDSAEHLINKNYSSPNKLYIMGGSAGGLLIGAVLNERPELFKAAITSVPFVDVLTTILDDSLPLTTGEYEEWGNPGEKIYYEYMKSYSPYDNIKETKYPHISISTGYHDPRVQYWEPAKWTAKLRQYKTDNNLLVLSTNMGTGHFGDTGRFGRLKLTASEYAFMLGIEQGLLK